MLLVSGTFDIEGKTVLLVEDDAILAAEMGKAVTAAGGTVIGPASSVEKAQLLLDNHPHIDAAVLDVRLQDGISTEIAQKLNRRGVALIMVTGYDDWFTADDLLDIPLHCNPNDASKIVRLLFGHHLSE